MVGEGVGVPDGVARMMPVSAAGGGVGDGEAEYGELEYHMNILLKI